MRKYLLSFLKQHPYPEQDAAVLLSAYDKITTAPIAKQWESLLSYYDENADFSTCDGLDLIKRAREIADTVGVHRYTTELLLFICMSETLLRRYKERNISDTVFHHTMQDLYYKCEECKLMYGIVGSFVSNWFIGFFTLNRFAFGRLQFELIPFGQNCTIGDVLLTPDDRVINIHIPRTGTPLTPQACEDSYAEAAAFFREELSGKMVFHCSSWLLYPKHELFLPKTSNLLTFAQRFTIIDEGEYGDDHPNLWRLFDTSYNGDPDSLPSDSSLRRAYIQWLKSGEKTGWGKGIFNYCINAQKRAKLY